VHLLLGRQEPGPQHLDLGALLDPGVVVRVHSVGFTLTGAMSVVCSIGSIFVCSIGSIGSIFVCSIRRRTHLSILLPRRRGSATAHHTGVTMAPRGAFLDGDGVVQGGRGRQGRLGLAGGRDGMSAGTGSAGPGAPPPACAAPGTTLW
jgi:hypothetical protein